MTQALQGERLGPSVMSIFIKGQGCRTPSPGAQRANQSVFESSNPISERNNGEINLLLVLNFERISR